MLAPTVTGNILQNFSHRHHHQDDAQENHRHLAQAFGQEYPPHPLVPDAVAPGLAGAVVQGDAVADLPAAVLFQVAVMGLPQPALRLPLQDDLLPAPLEEPVGEGDLSRAPVRGAGDGGEGAVLPPDQDRAPGHVKGKFHAVHHQRGGLPPAAAVPPPGQTLVTKGHPQTQDPKHQQNQSSLKHDDTSLFAECGINFFF